MKKICSMLLSVCLALSAFVSPVWADGQEPPAIIQNTWNAAPGDAIGIYGANFVASGMQTEVLLLPISEYHGEDTPEGNMYSLPLLALDDGVIQTVISENVPKDIYVGFVKVGSMYSRPCYINEPQCDWLSETEICAGQTVRVFGRNFVDPTGAGKTQVYVCAEDGSASYPAQVTAITPYKLDFIVPDMVVPGTKYIVKVGTGSSGYATGVLAADEAVTAMTDENFDDIKSKYGIELGWASQLNDEKTFNVKDYGAQGNGTASDVAAVNEALRAAAAEGGGVIYFPAGRYNLTSMTDGFTIPDNSILLGDGKEASVILIDKRVNAAQSYSGIAKIGLLSELLRPEDDTTRRISGYVGSILIASGENVHFFMKDAALTTRDGSSIVSYMHQHIAIEDSSFDITHQGPMFMNEDLSTYMKIRFVNNYVTNTQRSMLWTGTHSWIDGCTFEGNNGGENCEKGDKGTVATMEHRISEMWGDKLYYGNNKIIGTIGDQRQGFDDNSGEGICNQATQRIQVNNLTNATANTIQANVDFDRIKAGEDPVVQKRGKQIIGAKIAITSGRGTGQVRRVVGAAGDTITVDRDWDVIPEPGDVFYIDGAMPERYIIVNNQIEAKTRKGGIMLYNNSYDNVIDNNVMTNSGGIWLGKAQVKEQNRNTISFYNYIANNQLSGGIMEKEGGLRDNALSIGTGDDGGVVLASDPDINAVSQFGNLYRRNTINGSGKTIMAKSSYNESFVKYNGFVVATPDTNNRNIEMVKGLILDQNVNHNSVNGVTLSNLAYNTFLYNNDFTDNKIDYNDSGSVKTVKADAQTEAAVVTEGKPAGLSAMDMRPAPVVAEPPEDPGEGTPEEPEGPVKTFTDIQNHWAKGNIEQLAKLNLVKGVDADHFCPDQAITRAEFTSLVMRALQISYPQYQFQGLFSDVYKEDWYSMIIERAFLVGLYDKNMTPGWNALPTAPITREEMAVLLVNGMDYAGQTRTAGDLSKFPDAGDVTPWAAPYMEAACGKGLFTGNEQGLLQPRNTATRAEAVIVLEKLLRNL